jgi:hypothetical protein
MKTNTSNTSKTSVNPAPAVQPEAPMQSQAENTAEAPVASKPIQPTSASPLPSAVALVEKYSYDGFHTFRQMNQMSERIAAYLDLPQPAR